MSRYNGKTDLKANTKALEWAKANNKLMVSGSDFHVVKNLARGGIITDKPINNNSELLEVLKKQNFRRLERY